MDKGGGSIRWERGTKTVDVSEKIICSPDDVVDVGVE